MCIKNERIINIWDALLFYNSSKKHVGNMEIWEFVEYSNWYSCLGRAIRCNHDEGKEEKTWYIL